MGVLTRPIIDDKKKREELFDIIKKNRLPISIDSLLSTHINCGIHALSHLIYYQYGYFFLEELIKLDRDYFIELTKKVENDGISIFDIVKIVNLFSNDLYPDLRYSTHTRDLSGRIFESGHRGIAALKFVNNNLSHWVYFDKRGYESDMDRLRQSYPKLDGVGQVAVFRDREDTEVVKNTYSQKCDGYLCPICCRRDFCHENSCSN